MKPGGDPFKFMIEIDRLAADLHRLGAKFVTELRKCVIIVSGLSAGFEMECRMLENNPGGLNKAEIERVVGNQYNRLLSQQQDSKALSALKGTSTANRGKGKNRRLHHKFNGNCFNCGKKGHRAGDCRSAKKSEKSGAADDKKKGGGSGRCYICGSEEHFAHRHCGLCKSLEHRTRDCEERGAEKGAMLAKLTVPAVPKGLFSATGARRIPRQEVALGANLTENGLVRIASGTALAMRAGVSRDVMEVHRMLAHPSEDITRKMAEMVGIETMGQWGACETCFYRLRRSDMPCQRRWTDGRA